jgi:hypothetical protein
MTGAAAATRRHERLTALLSILALFGCLALAFGGCGGDDLVFPGNITFPSRTAESATPTPDEF